MNSRCDLYPDVCERHWDKMQSDMLANEGADGNSWADECPIEADVSMDQLEADVLDFQYGGAPSSPASSTPAPLFPPSPAREPSPPRPYPSRDGSGDSKLCFGVSDGQQVASGAANANPAPALWQVIALLRTLISTLPLGPQAPVISALLDSIVELVQASLGSGSADAKPAGSTPTLPIQRRSVNPGVVTARQAKAQRAKAGPATGQPRQTTAAPPRRQAPAPVDKDGFTVVTARRAPKSYATAVSGNAGPARGGQKPRVQQAPNRFASAAKKATTSGSRPVVIIRPTGQNPAPLSKAQFSALRVTALQALPKDIVVTGVFPVGQVSIGLSIRDAAAVPSVISFVDAKLTGYSCSKKQTRFPRIICFGAAVSRDISAASLEKLIREENASVFTGKNVPSGIVQSIHWRGPNLVVAASPEFFRALEASKTQKLKINHLLTRWSRARDSTICFYCSKLGHISPNCPEKANGKDCTCTRCAGSHERQQCNAGGERCRNCLDFNQQQARLGKPGRRQANHQATSAACPSAQAFCRRLAERTDFGAVAAPSSN
ncbi:hypothetical protein Pmar_PMAR011645 [Perkinsus marinus ATCC 50983]|uniref:CCHC-type domain-containing protein n=1 Tax=Perkinsus marinus (strain ATCC 50983 / TXsc) TaxID=423536 RepID=C5LCD1_PERM5|nr:hypothetical protein Pmar_PMAR011645 [Perkinsus marinus ATCC 50983]EER05614.1 hypothetical protein Pmar_PMAR011645 [Perkinsus marinus ATCC 50983]|eukprot:XP_002773798.1 hypothetical protein Pmar_PMAR011645 [Perkinsus marinus ATCC 50983]